MKRHVTRDGSEMRARVKASEKDTGRQSGQQRGRHAGEGDVGGRAPAVKELDFIAGAEGRQWGL